MASKRQPQAELVEGGVVTSTGSVTAGSVTAALVTAALVTAALVTAALEEDG